jgi:carboxypeptidase Taq
VHWSSGAFGYFPSYTLGNLYAASLGEAITQAIPDLWTQIAAGEFNPVLTWLRDNIHRHGHLKDAPDLIRDAIGERDAVEDLMNHLWNRHGALHGVRRPDA